MNDVIEFLNQPVLEFMSREFTVGMLTLIPLMLIVAVWLLKFISKIIPRLLIKNRVTPDAVHLINRVVQILVLVMLVITTLDILNVPLTAFAFVSGAVAIGVGFGAQNIINNFISGWILMWERPIRIGDTLEVDDTRGRVEAINTRSTRIRRVDGVHMLVPNSKLLENTVINWNLVNTETRTSVKVGVAYGSSVREVEQLIYSAVGKLDGVLKTPAPAVMFDDFGDNALNFEVYYWLNASSEMERRKSRSDLRFLICEAFEKAGIVVAFPQRDVHIDGELVLTKTEQNWRP
ncbi:mechanosensitive ion channel domain-containing protein [Alteromonas sp. CNT1-28]|jgi:small-conductance mechanosensitive channel|uniref:mechanosensitive ion channel family protein n=2 Tax=unclassified Alteromonas TaxID=2614992 RepID=UPI001EF1D37F|nr:mechanosensitive ion channel domain-containing protein [Alteromonas sp. CNT1-28]MCG7636554.1 mechanosensitive ion channel [Alteromonas sp. CNT1-28]